MRVRSDAFRPHPSGSLRAGPGPAEIAELNLAVDHDAETRARSGHFYFIKLSIEPLKNKHKEYVLQ